MATLKKKKSRLGTPPPAETVRDNLIEPETAPAKSEPVDKRTLRKTGRTQQFNTRVSKDFLDLLRKTAKNEGRTMGKIMELALVDYAKNKTSS